MIIYLATIKEIVALKFRENMGCVQEKLQAREKEENYKDRNSK